MTADHVVDPTDENRHTPDADDLWNESYYADFVQADGSWGGWIRLGLYPNRQVAWWTAWIVGPDRRGVCSVNYAVPVPAGTGLVAEEAGTATRIELDLQRPLAAFRIAADAPAEVFERPEDAYGGVPAAAARLGVDLTWTTDGTPYHYDLTTRYEIPCLVSGTVTIDGETLAVEGQGQRDHSWGVRDWWAFGWCWSSARLDDGTRVHLADIRMPGFPIAFGYVQEPGGTGGAGESGPAGGAPGAVHPLASLTMSEDAGAHGFPTTARLDLTAGVGQGDGPPPVELGITVTPLAYGPVLLRNDDGRTSHFPRAMVRYAADDGREGLGWIEWNQPDPVEVHP
jgi:hypothetical protein